MALADRLKTLAPSATLAVQAKAKELRARGVDVISFGAGEPDFDTPERIKDAGGRGDAARPDEVHRGRRRARAARGDLRQAQARQRPRLRAGRHPGLRRRQAHALQPGRGAAQPGRRGAGAEPVLGVVSRAGAAAGRRRRCRCRPPRRAASTSIPIGCAAAVTPRTKLIVLNSPNNPTGAVFSRAALEAVARLAVERDLWVVSDECYEALTFEGRHVSIASFGPEIKARTIVVNTCSKAYAMTGWRIGYAAGPTRADPRHDRRAEPGDVEPVVDRAVGGGGGARPARRTRSRRWRASSTGVGGSIVAGLNALPGVSLRHAEGRVLRLRQRLGPVRADLAPERGRHRARRARSTSPASSSKRPGWRSCRARTSAPTRTSVCPTRPATR